MDLKVTAVDFVIGFMVGMTDMGGGALMTSALIVLGWARPIVGGGPQPDVGHAHQACRRFRSLSAATVDFPIVKRLALGGIPGVARLALLARSQVKHAQAMDRIMVGILRVTLICVALSLLVRSFWGRAFRARMQLDPSWPARSSFWAASLCSLGPTVRG
jgi:uncharacterized protein